jgi:hypothetical protein
MAESATPHPVEILTQMISGFRLPRALQVAARLDLGRRLEEHPRPASELAAELGLDPPLFQRFMCFLAENGIFAEREDGVFGGTELSRHLHLVDSLFLGDEGWALWTALPDALRTGRPVFESVHGLPFFEYAAQHPDRNANWKEWNTITAGPWLQPAVRALKLKGSETLVDVGGGQGNFLAEVLSANLGCKGVLYDLPEVVDTAREYLASRGVADRCTIVAGSAFDSVPGGGDVYLISRVLFNWDDEHARLMLKNTAAAMSERSRVFVIEILMPERGDRLRGWMAGNDLYLFLQFGSRHRTRDEMQELFDDAGLAVLHVGRAAPPRGIPWDVIEGRRR